LRDFICFFLNGQLHSAHGADVFTSLTDFLRGRLGLTGTKVVCAEGDCGACTILLGRFRNGCIHYEPVDACLLFLYQIDAKHVVTIEGLSPNGQLDPIQQAMIDHHGSQCGYCTPGFVMALAGWRENREVCDLRTGLTGNLCRCTGYLPILESAAAVDFSSAADQLQDQALGAEMARLEADSIYIEAEGQIYFAPTELSEAEAFKASHPEAVIVAGGTELGVLRNKHGLNPDVLLSLAGIAELQDITTTEPGLRIGANVSWTQVAAAVREVFPEFYHLIQRFGSPQIRNVATLVGNVAHGSPIADSLPLLTIMDAKIEIVSVRGFRQRAINGFYTGYKQLDLAKDELIAHVVLPLPASEDRIRLYKISQRRDLDIATFGAGIRVRENRGIVEDVRIALIGVAPTVVRLPRTEASLRGQPFSESSFRAAGKIARAEITPISDVRGSADFRWQLAENILPRFYFEQVESRVPA
jgi:xanthine dehydrogenase small subunit